MFGQNPQRTGRSPYSGPEIPKLKWSFTTGGIVNSPPAIGSDGTIYVGSNDNKLYAINPDGSLKWSFPTGVWVDSSPAIGADGTIYVGSRDNKLYAINPDGSPKWSFTTGGIVSSSPAIGADGTIYVGSGDNKLYAIETIFNTAIVKWIFTTGDWVMSSPAIGADGTIYVGSGDKKLYAINPDGTKKWSFTTGGIVWSSPAIGADGTIYVGSVDKKIYAINPNGSQKWSFTTGGEIDSSSPAIGADGTIYVGSHDNKLYAINPGGTKKWDFTTVGAVFSSPAIGADGTIYVGSHDYKLYAINPDGSQKWSFTTGGNVNSSPAIGADGTIYVGSCDHKLYAITGVTECVATATGTGTACFTPSHGIIEDLEALPAIPPGAPAGIMFPHGMFSFKITGLSSGQEVTITIELPAPVPAGTKWWKYQAGAWYSMPIGDDDGDKIITVTLKDGDPGQGDTDSIAGQITDPGGPGSPPSKCAECGVEPPCPMEIPECTTDTVGGSLLWSLLGTASIMGKAVGDVTEHLAGILGCWVDELAAPTFGVVGALTEGLGGLLSGVGDLIGMSDIFDPLGEMLSSIGKVIMDTLPS